MDKRERIVIFIDNRFGYQKGGCSTVNYELCLALQQITYDNIKVVALVINCDKEDRVEELEKKARDLGISIIHKNILNDIDMMSADEYRDIVHSIDSIDDFITREMEKIWIGHDIFTGEYAIRLAEYSQGKSVVCIHTDYDTIEGLKGVNREGILKENKQRLIIQRADMVFAIGPRLLERVREVREYNVFELLPGMPFIGDNRIFNKRAVIAYGRFEGNVARVKQVHLVLAAFGKAVAMMNNNKDYVLHIIGSPQDEDEERRLREIAEKYAGRKLSINFLRYTQDRKRLFACLQNNCAGLMISISEGFGLAGWEMISAGIPLILTRKSGLYDYLYSRFGYLLNGMCLPVDLKGSSLENIREEDVEAVAERITIVFKAPDKLRDAAQELRLNLKNETWHKAAGCLAKDIGLLSVDYSTADIYSDTYKARKESIEEILNAIEAGEIGEHYLIFFGGISRALCEKRAITKISQWLQKDADRKLFICYETGMAARQRADELDRKTLISDDNLSKNPQQRMKEKEELIEKSYFLYPNDVQKQITFVKLENSPMTYTMIIDKQIYFTVLLQTRSSESMTMKLNTQFKHECRVVIESLEFVLKKQKINKEEKMLLTVLSEYKAKYL